MKLPRLRQIRRVLRSREERVPHRIKGSLTGRVSEDRRVKTECGKRKLYFEATRELAADTTVLGEAWVRNAFNTRYIPVAFAYQTAQVSYVV